MDTSPKYIDMCRKANEIQNEFFISEIGYFFPTFVYNIIHNSVGFITKIPTSLKNKLHINDDYIEISLTKNENIIDNDPPPLRESVIWLPRQDQFQEIIIEKLDWFDCPFDLIEALYKSLTWQCDIYTAMEIMETMEQFLLAFVMREIYNKQWIDNDWRKVDG